MIITYGTFKGGVGKTTLAGMTGVVLAQDSKVLLVDLDYQANLTTILGKYKPDINGKSMYNIVKLKQPIKDNIVRLSDNLHLIPASKKIPHNITNTFFTDLAILGYDYVIIDTRPDLTNLVEGALIVSDLVRIVLEPNAISLDGAISYYNHIFDLGLDADVELVLNKYKDKRDSSFLQHLPLPYITIPHSDRLYRYASTGLPKELDIYDINIINKIKGDLLKFSLNVITRRLKNVKNRGN